MTIQEAITKVKEAYPFPDRFNGPRYENIVKHVMKYLSPSSKVLDLGSGPCEVAAVLSTLGYDCTGYDDLQDEWLSKVDGRRKIFDFAKEMKVKVELVTSEHMPFEKESFDLFMMNDVLEHLHDSPRELLNDGLERVRPEGYLLITVPSVVNIRKRVSVLLGKTNLPDYDTYFWYPGKWRGPVREYTRGDLKNMCKFLNLKVVELKACHHMLDRVPASIRPIYQMLTSIFPDWKDTWILVAQKPKDWQPNRVLSDQEFTTIMQKTKKEHRKGKVFY